MTRTLYTLFSYLFTALNPDQKPAQVRSYEVNIIQEVDRKYLLVSRVLNYGSIIPSYLAIAEVHLIDAVVITKLLPGADKRELDYLSSALSKWEPK